MGLTSQNKTNSILKISKRSGKSDGKWSILRKLNGLLAEEKFSPSNNDKIFLMKNTKDKPNLIDLKTLEPKLESHFVCDSSLTRYDYDINKRLYFF